MPKLLSQTKFLDQFTVALDVDLLQIGKKSSSVSDHDEQSASGVMVLLMALKVFIELVDALCEEGDLYFR